MAAPPMTKAAMDQRMASRHQQLKDKWSASRDEQSEAGSVVQAARDFWEAFSREQRSIERAVADLLDAGKQAPPAQPGPGAEPPHKAALDGLVQRVRTLQETISKHNHALPKYDVKRAVAEAEELLGAVERARGVLQPRKKFAFSRRRQPGPAPADAAAGEGQATVSDVSTDAAPVAAAARSDAATPPVPPAAEAEASKPTPVQEFTHSFIGKTAESLLVAPGALHGPSDYFLKDLVDCTIVLRQPLQALKLQNLTACRLYVGPVAGSIFARNLHGCTVFAAGRQLRIHDSTACDWFVHMASGPIIEDCQGMRFAPFTLNYPELPAQLADASLPSPADSDHWSRVKDFKWHRAQQSPNWSVLPVEERGHRPPAAVAHLVCNSVAAANDADGGGCGDGGAESEDEL